ncbi:TetR/AcrR family transcriptional regulator [Microbacterium phyllosphaerae]|uniref:TetR/AcrR family transcriptional regulator n=1 Tax=Microbacterium phyllosphaerae TaxID=124798 RepID=UPI002167E90E|nr:TetR/AcrR family transcriptional regulator [Microbacterium phyllosphaerae]MCS3444179.1 AcrR family transcriptional regulator [Microbacterium phyllosphaerae]
MLASFKTSITCGFEGRNVYRHILVYMAARGPYAKGRAKRAEILDAAIEVIARDGYSGATVRQLGEAVGLSQNGLLHYFGSKDTLFTRILEHQDERNAAEVNPDHTDFALDLVDRILDAIDLETASPGMAQLTLRLSGEATEPSHTAHEFFRFRYEAIRAIVRDAVKRLQETGRMRRDADPDAIAILVYASWDGLRTQWMYDPSVDMRKNMSYLLERLGLIPR